MAQLEKIDVQKEIKSSGNMFYEVLSCKAHLLPKICPKMIKDIELLEGDWDSVGSVKQWTYYDAGDCVKGKEMVKVIDKQNKYIVFDILEGEIMKYYKSFTSSLKVTKKEDSRNWVVKWSLEYEKLNEDIEAPTTYLDYVVTLTKNIDAYLLLA